MQRISNPSERFQTRQYEEADTYNGTIEIQNAGKQDASFTVPLDDEKGETVYIICEVTDDGTPPLMRCQYYLYHIQYFNQFSFKNHVYKVIDVFSIVSKLLNYGKKVKTQILEISI